MTEKTPANQQETEQPSQLRLPVGAAEEEVGARLRHQRLKRRISIDEAAKALKLTPSTLREIESGELGRFESLYRRGYLRNYARFLGLDPEPLLQMVQGADLPPLRTVLPVKTRGPNFDRFLKIATYAIVTTLIIPPLVLIYIQGGLGFLDRDRSAVVNLEEGAGIAPDLVIESPLPGRAAEGSVEPDAGTPGPVTASALPLSYIRPVRDIASEHQGTAQEIGPQQSESGDDEMDPLSELLVELLEDSWLEVYAADGRRLEFDLLRAGAERRFVAEPPFRLLVGRGNAVHLILDGEPVGFEGQERGDVVRFEISPDGVVLRD